MIDLSAFFEELESSIQRNDFVKITLSKPLSKQFDLTNVYIRYVKIKDAYTFSMTYRYKTKDQVKNYTLKQFKEVITDLALNHFRFISLFTLKEDVQVLINTKKKITIRKVHASFTNKLPETHDVPKEVKTTNNEYLFHLGICDKDGNIIPKMASKYKQINKYLEIIENQIQSTKLPNNLRIVDMGSGKGYLTFALYDFLQNKGYQPHITGIELREDLVNYCTKIALKCKFKNLKFIKTRVENYKTDKIDILIALHACDTATDDALLSGMNANAKLIITAPCCHKALRKQLKGKSAENPILKYGIFKERQLEMVTDTLRALYLEKNNYQTSIFEFVSNEHTRKNIMLIGKKSSKNKDITFVNERINKLKTEFKFDNYYLEDKLM
jgi:hypothetical protein